MSSVEIMFYLLSGLIILFSILLTSHISEKFEQVTPRKAIFSFISVAAGAILAILTIVQYNFPQTIIASKDVPMKQIGASLVSYTKDGYVLPFEVISILLLAAMFGAIVIAKKETNPKN
jgi:NADH-quinone oxidoreductase subunit J